MSILADTAFLIALILVVEKAVLFHVRTYAVVTLGEKQKLRDPPMFRPFWRVLLYCGYLLGGLASLQGIVPKPVGYALILAPIFVFVVVDLASLRSAARKAAS